jgi:8-oxo-dGTP diphosphatase
VTDTSEHRPNTSRTFVEPEIYYAGLAAAYVTAGALITDRYGRVLLVDPNYRDHWLLPGGSAEDNEPPEVACARELEEELGLNLPVGPLLVVGWAPADGPRVRPTVSFVFDGGTLDRPERIRLQEEELDGYAFLPPAEAAVRLGPSGARLPVAFQARAARTTLYQPLS